MKTFNSIIILLVLISCSKPQKKATLTNDIQKLSFEHFPKNWLRLTEIDNELVLYFPCNLIDKSIQLTELSNGDWLLRFYHLDEYTSLLIQDFYKKNNKAYLKTINRKTKDIIVFELENYDTFDNLTIWNWQEIDKKQSFVYFNPKSDLEFKTVYQPCSECPEVPCDEIEVKEGVYQFELPYKLSLDGNDFREIDLVIEKDSTVNFSVYYYSNDDKSEGEFINYNGKAQINSSFIELSFELFDDRLKTYFNPLKEKELEYINDNSIRFNKMVDGLIIDGVYCTNWAKNIYNN